MSHAILLMIPLAVIIQDHATTRTWRGLCFSRLFLITQKPHFKYCHNHTRTTKIIKNTPQIWLLSNLLLIVWEKNITFPHWNRSSEPWLIDRNVPTRDVALMATSSLWHFNNMRLSKWWHTAQNDGLWLHSMHAQSLAMGHLTCSFNEEQNTFLSKSCSCLLMNHIPPPALLMAEAKMWTGSHSETPSPCVARFLHHSDGMVTLDYQINRKWFDLHTIWRKITALVWLLVIHPRQCVLLGRICGQLHLLMRLSSHCFWCCQQGNLDNTSWNTWCEISILHNVPNEEETNR